MTTIIKNTNIKELMEVASGNFQVLERMTEEFRRLVRDHPRKPISPGGTHLPMTTEQAIAVVTEVIRENRENGELEGTLNRHRIAALNFLVRVAQASTTNSKVPCHE
jgi:hypothetical protein